MLEYSIVATTYNDDTEIAEYLDNILSQNKLPKEIIIADGGSSDKTVEVLEKYKGKSSVLITILSGKRLNIPQGYNAAILACTTDYIGITGVGNYYPEDFFACLSNEMETKNSDIVYSRLYGLDTTRYSVLYNNLFLNGKEGKRLSIASNHGVLIKKEIFEKEGLFYEKFIYAGEDTEFYHRIRNKGYRIECINTTKVFWKTPQTLKEYCKQEKNYMIANMQIDTTLSLLFRYRYSLIIVMLFIVGLFNAAAFVFLFFIVLLLSMKYKNFWYGIVKVVNCFITTYDLVTNCRYLSKKYKVDRGT